MSRWLWKLRFRAARRLAQSVGQDLVRRSVFSPVPKVPPATSEVWRRPAPMPGVDLDTGAQLEYLESCLAPYVAEFAPPRSAAGNGDFHLLNGWYGPVDAELLYATVRHWKPRRVLELGSGYSTLVTAAACAANQRDGHPVELSAVDPEPRLPLDDPVPGLAAVERRHADDLPLERFLELGSGDILFVDTSHTVKRGSEVNFLVLQVLPRLADGVLVHFHDVFLPYEYPRAWFARGTYPAEQYLLHAFLACSTAYTILLATHAVARAHPVELRRVAPSLDYAGDGPMAFWLRRRGIA